MVLDSENEEHYRTFHFDGTLLELGPEEEALFKVETGIQDPEELRKHIIDVHEEAYKVFPYPCIRAFRSTNVQVSKAPAYPRVLELVKSRPDAIFLDIGCCLGTEVRKVIHDGWPTSQTIATDIEAGFLDLGHKLFRTTPDTYPAKFLAGDAFDDAHLSPTTPAPSGPAAPVGSANSLTTLRGHISAIFASALYRLFGAPTTPSLSGPPPPVGSVNTLTELRGHVSAIFASALFQLFGEEKQFELGKRLAGLLDSRPGSIIFGSHTGGLVKGQRLDPFGKTFCHSPETWTQMWEEQIFEKGQVKVNTVLKELDVNARGMVVPTGEGTKFYWLSWSVERM